ncbi:MAG TPA: NTF2-like N-terminal transpeptidase domain-containing protein, partial [Solirubrobacteraceae bacterium]|nr:NTF2-like N-terminal transpeptidase domain-containing protein [Solirubrobacteraceae bacterium]
MAFAIGAILGAGRGSQPQVALASRFVGAWTKGRYAAMYAQLAPSSRRAISAGAFAASYQRALVTATATRAQVVGRARLRPHGEVAVPVRVRTRLFGTLRLEFTLGFVATPGGPRVAWSPSLAFPGLPRGELLSRETSLPRRAPLLARDGSTLAEAAPGQSTGAPPVEGTRGSPLGAYADAVLGEVGPIPSSRRRALEEQG